MEASRHEPSDRIRIRQWSVSVGIGAYEHEQSVLQELILDLTMEGDFRAAGTTDLLAEAVDYAELKSEIEAWLAGRRWQLLEALGEQLCRKVLEWSRVSVVRLVIEKPAALAPALVSYELTRRRPLSVGD